MIISEKNNQVTLKGRCETEPKFSHSVMGEGFYEFVLSVPRLSNETDYLPITISERILDKIEGKEEIGIIGQLRSYNKLEDDKSKLILTVFVREIVPASEIQYSNLINLTGYVCKEPIYRTTPFGREITDVLVAVNRAYNKSDYLPCIAWGRNARFMGDLEVGKKIEVTGRIQSRKYTKKIDGETIITKTAYEVSISSVMSISEEYQEEQELNQNSFNENSQTMSNLSFVENV